MALPNFTFAADKQETRHSTNQSIEKSGYVQTRLNFRAEPTTNGNVIEVLNTNEQIKYVKYNNGWFKTTIDGKTGYVHSRYVKNKKVTIKSTSKDKIRSGGLTKQKGVVYYNGHRETYYSQRVLPGGGLNIPGRHVAADGTIRDKDGYICVASNDYSKGTIVETSLGTGKVYDCGCPSGTIDIYTDWT